MNRIIDQAPESTGPSINLGDIYYTLFRHKWKVMLFGLVGLGAAAAVYYTEPRMYQSRARLLLRYVQEEKAIGTNDAIKTPGGRGDTTISAEISIISSLDVSRMAAEAVGPEKIIGSEVTANPKQVAAQIINSGLTVEVPRGSAVLELAFAHTNAAVVQPVLNELINTYLKRHLEIHRPGAKFDDSFVQQTDQLKAKLAQTEEHLLRARRAAGIISLVHAKQVFGDRISSLQNAKMSAEASLAESRALFKRMMDETAGRRVETAPESPTSEPPVDLSTLPLAEYQRLMERYNLTRQRQEQLLLAFTPESSRVKEVAAQIAELESKKAELEKNHPALIRVAPRTAPAPGVTVASTFDPVIERARISGLETRIEVLKSQLEQVRAESDAVESAEIQIQDLERRRKMEEENYTFLSSSLEQARIREALGAGRVTNIFPVQTPTPPSRVVGNTTKIAAGIAAGGFVLGIAWAFIIELFLDRTIKRPTDVRKLTGLNLFLSIPRATKRRRLLGGASKPALPGPQGETNGAAAPDASGALAPWHPDDELQPYYSALRDRLIGYFESANIVHKPKLIALAGVGKNSGDAAVAAGLAGSLSETEGGNVLFVDMTAGQGTAQQFFKGKVTGNIDDALSAREGSQVQDKLYVVSEMGKGAQLPRALPMRFNHLIPKLKASDFDYIIFNMPPVSPISVTPRLAGYMDMVLLVIESEHADRDLVARARDLLAESKTPVGAVLNKTRSYVPHLLQQDFVGLD